MEEKECTICGDIVENPSSSNLCELCFSNNVDDIVCQKCDSFDIVEYRCLDGLQMTKEYVGCDGFKPILEEKKRREEFLDKCNKQRKDPEAWNDFGEERDLWARDLWDSDKIKDFWTDEVNEIDFEEIDLDKIVEKIRISKTICGIIASRICGEIANDFAAEERNKRDFKPIEFISQLLTSIIFIKDELNDVIKRLEEN